MITACAGAVAGVATLTFSTGAAMPNAYSNLDARRDVAGHARLIAAIIRDNVPDHRLDLPDRRWRLNALAELCEDIAAQLEAQTWREVGRVHRSIVERSRPRS